jgi:hypothetical protein
MKLTETPYSNKICLPKDGTIDAIVNDHNYVFGVWMKSKIKNAVLLHVDGHSDMYDGCPVFPYRFVTKRRIEAYTKKLNIVNFICAAVHRGIISEVYWYNPIYDSELLKKYELDMKISGKNEVKWTRNPEYACADPDLKEIIPQNVTLDANTLFILDVDLDAFASFFFSQAFPERNKSNLLYPQRICRTMNLLKDLKRPDLITIARSPNCIDPVLSGQVETEFKNAIYRLYGKG